MPEKYGFEHQDLEPLILYASKKKKKEQEKNAQRTGQTETRKKNTSDSKMKKLDEETENLSHEKVSKSISKTIQEKRLAKGLKQSELANKINEPVKVVQSYENGVAQPDIKVLLKLQKALGCKLTGKGFTK